ncbi:AAA family ATPase [Pseudanabaena sp. UWO310]|uniref:AAA family ATPase n=1 Tax=Pseudanabaena sp. UWO310 TaxID=2480795 RepID=UPI00115A1995|nr:ATP/GTP-binding protein [Pseudanabaena sp. UWO310]TYQ27101.1 AAA family ATPase [Pseudanabaena sp. UWO310]
MLIQFTIENFLSFRDEVTFSMVAVNSDNQHSDHLAQNEAGEGRSVLPIAAIYGANAAGKSNLIKAMSFVKSLVVKGTRSNQSISVTTFKLGDYDKEASKFEFIFTHLGSQYSYGFILNKEQIIEEWLHGIPKGKKKEVMYFERFTSTSSKKETSVEFGIILKGRSATKGKDSNRHLNLKFIATGTRPNQLFLTEAIDRRIEILMPVFNWFKNVLMIVPAESNFKNLEVGVAVDDSFTDFLSKFLVFAGTGIEAISTDMVELDFDNHFPTMSKGFRDSILEELEENSVTTVENSQGGRFLLFKDKNGLVNLTQLKTSHRHENGDLIDFSMDEESEGTQRLINLIPSLYILGKDVEKVVFIDELDRRLHPLLSRRFVESAINYRSTGNQLIFTTHDTNLLDLDLLRRDEIWFVEKNKNGISDCYSLAEFKVRPDLKVEKGYLNGRFGSIPFFGDPKKLGWFEYEEASSSAVS